MSDRELFRQVFLAGLALMRGVASSADIAMAQQRWWERRSDGTTTFESELTRIADLPPGALQAVCDEVDATLVDDPGDGTTSLRVPSAGRYGEFLLVGEGGMGAVYLALDKEMNRHVALKIVRPRRQDPTGTTPHSPLDADTPALGTPASDVFKVLKHRFLQEAWITGGLEHPGIVPVYELGQTPKGVPYYTMRFVNGARTLRDAIEEVAGEPLEACLKLLEPFLRLCDTLAYAHSKGVIHRDLKPENVGLGEYGEVVVLDWGQARILDPTAHTATVWQEELEAYRAEAEFDGTQACGTPGYMAPEAALGPPDELTERADVYSLGAVLYEILTGSRPYEFESLRSYVKQIRSEEPPDPESLNPAIPRALAEACMAALVREPHARTPSVAVLAREIRVWEEESEQERRVAELRSSAEELLASAELMRASARLAHLEGLPLILGRLAEVLPEAGKVTDLELHAKGLRAEAMVQANRGRARRVASFSAAAVLVVLLIGSYAFVRALQAEQVQTRVALQRARSVALAAESMQLPASDAALAVKLASLAVEVRDSHQARSALIRALQMEIPEFVIRKFADIQDFALSSDGNRILVVDRQTVIARSGAGPEGSLYGGTHANVVRVYEKGGAHSLEFRLAELGRGSSRDRPHVIATPDGGFLVGVVGQWQQRVPLSGLEGRHPVRTL